MTRETLESMLNATRELEEKERKRMKVAEMFGKFIGMALASAIDTTAVWAIVNFAMGITCSWVAVWGGLVLLTLLLQKAKRQ